MSHARSIGSPAGVRPKTRRGTRRWFYIRLLQRKRPELQQQPKSGDSRQAMRRFRGSDVLPAPGLPRRVDRAPQRQMLQSKQWPEELRNGRWIVRKRRF